ncbi:MAG: hypothetical protein J1F02_03880, partial [Lachnospiraceae bacterium]|nr:hypothetical protein [Lachnospiraceae bacterium]
MNKERQRHKIFTRRAKKRMMALFMAVLMLLGCVGVVPPVSEVSAAAEENPVVGPMVGLNLGQVGLKSLKAYGKNLAGKVITGVATDVDNALGSSGASQVASWVNTFVLGQNTTGAKLNQIIDQLNGIQETLDDMQKQLDTIESLCEGIVEEVAQVESDILYALSVVDADIVDKLDEVEKELESDINNAVLIQQANDAVQKIKDARKNMDDAWAKVEYPSDTTVKNALTLFELYMQYAKQYTDDPSDKNKGLMDDAEDDYVRSLRQIYTGNGNLGDGEDVEKRMYTSYTVADKLNSMVTEMSTDLCGQTGDRTYIDYAAQYAWLSMPFTGAQYDFINQCIDRQMYQICFLEIMYQDYLSRQGNYIRENCSEDSNIDNYWGIYQDALEDFDAVNGYFALKANQRMDRAIYFNPASNATVYLYSYCTSQDERDVFARRRYGKDDIVSDIDAPLDLVQKGVLDSTGKVWIYYFNLDGEMPDREEYGDFLRNTYGLKEADVEKDAAYHHPWVLATPTWGGVYWPYVSYMYCEEFYYGSTETAHQRRGWTMNRGLYVGYGEGLDKDITSDFDPSSGCYALTGFGYNRIYALSDYKKEEQVEQEEREKKDLDFAKLFESNCFRACGSIPYSYFCSDSQLGKLFQKDNPDIQELCLTWKDTTESHVYAPCYAKPLLTKPLVDPTKGLYGIASDYTIVKYPYETQADEIDGKTAEEVHEGYMGINIFAIGNWTYDQKTDKWNHGNTTSGEDTKYHAYLRAREAGSSRVQLNGKQASESYGSSQFNLSFPADKEEADARKVPVRVKVRYYNSYGMPTQKWQFLTSTPAILDYSRAEHNGISKSLYENVTWEEKDDLGRPAYDVLFDYEDLQMMEDSSEDRIDVDLPVPFSPYTEYDVEYGYEVGQAKNLKVDVEDGTATVTFDKISHARKVDIYLSEDENFTSVAASGTEEVLGSKGTVKVKFDLPEGVGEDGIYVRMFGYREEEYGTVYGEEVSAYSGPEKESGETSFAGFVADGTIRAWIAENLKVNGRLADGAEYELYSADSTNNLLTKGTMEGNRIEIKNLDNTRHYLLKIHPYVEEDGNRVYGEWIEKEFTGKTAYKTLELKYPSLGSDEKYLQVEPEILGGHAQVVVQYAEDAAFKNYKKRTLSAGSDGSRIANFRIDGDENCYLRMRYQWTDPDSGVTFEGQWSDPEHIDMNRIPKNFDKSHLKLAEADGTVTAGVVNYTGAEGIHVVLTTDKAGENIVADEQADGTELTVSKPDDKTYYVWVSVYNKANNSTGMILYSTSVGPLSPSAKDSGKKATPVPTTKPTPTPTPEDTGIQVGEKATAGSGATKAVYKATGKNTVTYVKAEGKKSAKKATVPATVKIKGKKYKVTKIAKGAFKGYKKLKTVTVKAEGLTKKKVKGCFKGTSVKTVKVPKKLYKKYKKIFTKKITG